MPSSENLNPILGYCVGEALNTTLDQVLPLLAPNLDLISLVSFCFASKQLQDQCLDLSDQQLQSIVQKGLKQKEPKVSIYSRKGSGAFRRSSSFSYRRLLRQYFKPDCRDSCCNSLEWLLGALCKRWGIMQLAARLDLQQALLAAEHDSRACYTLIRAGARVTRHLLRSSGCNDGPTAWARAYVRLALSWDLPPELDLVLKEGGVRRHLQSIDLQGVDSQLLFELAGAAYKIDDSALVDACLSATDANLQYQIDAWSSEQVLELITLGIRRAYDDSLLCLLRFPAAQHITSSQYGDLLVMLLRDQQKPSLQDVAAVLLAHVQWDQQLVDQMAAAVKTHSSSKTPSGTPCTGTCCRICAVLGAIAVFAAGLSLQLQISLLCIAASTHREAAKALLQQVAASSNIIGATEGVAAVAAAIRCWPDVVSCGPDPVERLPEALSCLPNRPGTYRCYFKQLLQQPAVQQLPLAEVQQLLLQAVHSSCREGLQCLLEGLPAAQEVTGEGLQQLLGEALEGTNCSSSKQLVAVLVGCSQLAVQQLGPGELQLLMVKCLKQDHYRGLQCLLCGLKAAAEQLQFADVCELMLQAAALQAHGCMLELLQRPRQLKDVPVEVLQGVLPILMQRSCPGYLSTAADGVHGTASRSSSSSCITCSLLKAVAGKLSAADVSDVLVAASSAFVEHIHLKGLACLPGVDELRAEQVEQLLMAAIEAVGPGREGQPLLRKLEQLQGELLFSRRLSSSAAVHRLMVACVGKAVVGGARWLRGELGLQREWEGELSHEQLKQVLGVAELGRVSGGAASGEAIECHACLLMLAKLLPSLREKQQVVEGLWVAHVAQMRLPGVGCNPVTNPMAEKTTTGANLVSYIPYPDVNVYINSD